MEPSPYEAPRELDEDQSPSPIPPEFFIGMQRFFTFGLCLMATVVALWLIAIMLFT